MTTLAVAGRSSFSIGRRWVAPAAFLVLGLSHLLHMDSLHTLGGYIGMITALLAAYQATAEVVNEVNGKTVMPI